MAFEDAEMIWRSVDAGPLHEQVFVEGMANEGFTVVGFSDRERLEDRAGLEVGRFSRRGEV